MPTSLTLTTNQTLELTPRAPFNFDATFHHPDHFPSPDNAWTPGVRWQTMRWRDCLLGLKFEDRGTVEDPRVALTVWSVAPLAADFVADLRAEIGYRYNLDLDLADFYRRFAGDPQLGPVLARWRGLRPLNPNSLYEYLIIAIMLQNATVRRSVAMTAALLAQYGTRLHYDGQALDAFWAPADLAGVPEPALRELKVGYRAKSLLRVSTALAAGEVDEVALRDAPPAVQREALLGLYGIGPASVGYLLFDVFHRWDELSHISPWEQKIYSKLFCDRDPETPVPVDALLAHIADRFAGYRMLAVHYLWEDLWWRRLHAPVPWLEALIRL